MQGNLEGQGSADGQELCVRFVNTVAWRLRNPQEERIPSPDALLDWLAANGLCEPRDVSRLRAGDAGRKAEFHMAALALREAIYRLLRAPVAQEEPSQAALTLLNAWLARSSPGALLAPIGGAIGWRPSAMSGDLQGMLKPIAISAASLIASPRAGKVRQCSDDRGCGWLFVDESRAQNRRWCAMGDCGNRAKAVRHRARKRNASPLQE